MEMFENVGSVLANIGRTALFGFCAAVPLDFITVWDKIKKPSVKAVFAADIAYCLSIAFTFFIMLLTFSDGSIRLLWIISSLFGAGIYRFLLCKTVKKVLCTVFRAFERVKSILKRCVFVPLFLFVKKIVEILLKPLKFALEYIKIALYGFKTDRVRKRIAGRKLKWLRKQNKMQKRKADCSE